MHAYTLDGILKTHCLSNGVIYTRYADDLIFSSSNKQALDPLFGVVCRTLQSEFSGRMGINSQKTKYLRKGKIKLLGLNVLLMEELLWICGIKRNRGSSFLLRKRQS